jgi:hypothetical protein
MPMILTHILQLSPSLDSVRVYYDLFGSEWGKVIQDSSQFIEKSWKKLGESKKGNPNINGSIFEYLIALCLYAKGIVPFYMQAEMTFVPNAKYDIILYTDNDKPITLSIKSSLRERYKQADLEGWALKNVHRNADNFLLTLDEKEAIRLSKKIEKEEMAGLDKVIVANKPPFNDFIEFLSHYKLARSKQVDVIKKGKLIIG